MLHFHVSTVARSGQTNTGSIEDLSMLPVFLASSRRGKLFYCMMSSVTLRKLSKAWKKEPWWCHQWHPSLDPETESIRYKLWHSKDVRDDIHNKSCHWHADCIVGNWQSSVFGAGPILGSKSQGISALAASIWTILSLIYSVPAI